MNAAAGELVKSLSIANLLAQRDAVMERVEAAAKLLIEAETIAGRAGMLDVHSYRGFHRVLCGKDRYAEVPLLSADNLAGIRARLDAGAWNRLMHESGLRTFLDFKAREQWDNQIDKLETPPLDLNNIASTFAGLYEQRDTMFERGVIEVFKTLSTGFQTNQPACFGKRIHCRLRPGGGHYNWNDGSYLVDLQRVFCILDGKPEEDHRQNLIQRLSGHREEFRGVLDDVYMKIRWYKNGRAQVTFKRMDLVNRMNDILKRHFPGALPPPRETK